MNKITIVIVIASMFNNNRNSDNRVVGVPDVVSVGAELETSRVFSRLL